MYVARPKQISHDACTHAQQWPEATLGRVVFCATREYLSACRCEARGTSQEVLRDAAMYVLRPRERQERHDKPGKLQAIKEVARNGQVCGPQGNTETFDSRPYASPGPRIVSSAGS